jgi:uncharacterized membrane protein YdcZ (DUF606 family)
MREAGAQREDKKMQNAFADWLFNVLLLGGIVGILVLAANAFVAPILGGMTTLVALVLVLVVAAFWPKW